MSPNLTLNLGMRWEYITPIYEVADRQVNINTFTGQLIYADATREFGRALYKPYKKQFMPNLGFAWTPVQQAGRSCGLSLLDLPRRHRRQPSADAESAVLHRVERNLRRGGARRYPHRFRRSCGTETDTGQPAHGCGPCLQGRAWDLDLRPQFTNQFNFTIEYQVTSIDFRHGRLCRPARNPPGRSARSQSAAARHRDRSAPGLRSMTGVLLRARCPNVSNIALTESSGTMWYNSLQVSGRRRMSNGLEFLTAYTFSKTLTDNLGYYGCGGVNSDGAYWQNAYDRRANYGPACFDARHNFTVGGSLRPPGRQGQEIPGHQSARRWT